MSYFEFFCKNIEDKNKNSDVIRGTCDSMCPQDEVSSRKEADMVHVLEVMGPMRTFVKMYSRSAADSHIAQPNLLRPFPILRDTVQYLLLEVTKRVDVSASCVYDFVNDRLRAVRQDMIIQRLPSEECTKLLEPMIRFYVYYGYKLSHLPLQQFDPVLNKSHMLECMKWFLTCTDDNIDEITGLLSNLDLNYKLKCDRILIECLYVLCNLDNVHPLYRLLSLPKSLKSHPKLNVAYRIAIANLKGNYIEVCRLMERLCPLTYCAVCLYLPTIQRRALTVMSCAYSSKTLTVPAAALRQWLQFDSDADARAAATHYGMHASGGSVRFFKADFKHEQTTLTQKPLLMNKKFDLSIDNIFTYTTESLEKVSVAKPGTLLASDMKPQVHRRARLGKPI